MCNWNHSYVLISNGRDLRYVFFLCFQVCMLPIVRRIKSRNLLTMSIFVAPVRYCPRTTFSCCSLASNCGYVTAFIVSLGPSVAVEVLLFWRSAFSWKRWESSDCVDMRIAGSRFTSGVGLCALLPQSAYVSCMLISLYWIRKWSDDLLFWFRSTVILSWGLKPSWITLDTVFFVGTYQFSRAFSHYCYPFDLSSYLGTSLLVSVIPPLLRKYLFFMPAAFQIL